MFLKHSMRRFQRRASNFLKYREPFLGQEKTQSIGYARTGITGQRKELQLLALKEFGCSEIFHESISITTIQKTRPQLQEALKTLERGDELVVLSLDCLAGTADEFLSLIKNLHVHGIFLRTIDGEINTRSLREESFALIGILSCLAEVEESRAQEKKLESFQIRKLEGGKLGGRPRTNPIKEALVLRLRNEGCSYRSIRAQTGLSLSTIRRIIMEKEVVAV